ncbi:hypothetical protein [Rhabdaerophilum sp. SD176]|uniref:hypothetical protein n=1 Tax=Rhabdaerophilum sp. SD176 TaxID=2983548 RepID=UPI0024E03C38|nr:hypothetical protein [Rhabdaerophilum sp. SD176]
MAKAQLRHSLAILAGAGLAVGLGWCLRHLFLDNDAVRTLCDADANAWFCRLRAQLSLVLRNPAGGWVLLAMAVLTLWRPTRLRMAAALVLCSAGLVLYHADLASGAAALLLLHLALLGPTRDGHRHAG